MHLCAFHLNFLIIIIIPNGSFKYVCSEFIWLCMPFKNFTIVFLRVMILNFTLYNFKYFQHGPWNDIFLPFEMDGTAMQQHQIQSQKWMHAHHSKKGFSMCFYLIWKNNCHHLNGVSTG